MSASSVSGIRPLCRKSSNRLISLRRLSFKLKGGLVASLYIRRGLLGGGLRLLGRQRACECYGRFLLQLGKPLLGRCECDEPSFAELDKLRSSAEMPLFVNHGAA